MNAGVSARSPTDDAEVRAVPALLHVDGALEGPGVADVVISDARIAKVARGGGP